MRQGTLGVFGMVSVGFTVLAGFGFCPFFTRKFGFRGGERTKRRARGSSPRLSPQRLLRQLPDSRAIRP